MPMIDKVIEERDFYAKLAMILLGRSGKITLTGDEQRLLQGLVDTNMKIEMLHLSTDENVLMFRVVDLRKQDLREYLEAGAHRAREIGMSNGDMETLVREVWRATERTAEAQA